MKEEIETHLRMEVSNGQTIEVPQNDEETFDNQENMSVIRRDESLKRKRLRKRLIRQRTLNHERSGVQLVCCGNDRGDGREHRKVPKNRLIREAGNVLPVLVINEFGTSFRCPDCKLPDMDHETIGQPTTPQVSQDGNKAVHASTKENRIERCAHCSRG